ncbi:hypothetical protein MXB_5396, partial [Myxobolus squamalis]
YNYSNIDTPVLYSSEEPQFCISLWQKAVKEAQESIHRCLNNARAFLVSYDISNKSIDTFMKESTESAGEAICSVAAEMNANIVIMGKHNRGAFNRALLGSTSTYVVHHNKKPTMLK